MVIDTSAIAAILFDEPNAAALEGKIADDPVRLMSAATFLEAAIVIEAGDLAPGLPGLQRDNLYQSVAVVFSPAREHLFSGECA